MIGILCWRILNVRIFISFLMSWSDFPEKTLAVSLLPYPGGWVGKSWCHRAWSLFLISTCSLSPHVVCTILICYLTLWFYYRVLLTSVILNSLSGFMAPNSSTLAWKIPWTEEPDRLQSMGSLRVGHDWATSLWLFTFMLWRRKWQPTPVFLPGESQGRGSLVGCHLWGHTESDTTEMT